MSKKIYPILLITFLPFAGSIAVAQPAVSLPSAPVYKGEIRRGPDGRLTVQEYQAQATSLNGEAERWVVMGSSTAAGAGASRANRSWVGRLQAEMAVRSIAVINLARGGATTFEGLATESTAKAGRPKPNPLSNVDAAIAKRPSVLVVAYPSNDTDLGYSPDETVSNLLAIRATASRNGVTVIVLGTQPRPLRSELQPWLSEIDRRLEAAVSPCFVSLRTALSGSDGRLDTRFDSGDGVHPNDAGHALIHERLRTILDSGECVHLGVPLPP